MNHDPENQEPEVASNPEAGSEPAQDEVTDGGAVQDAGSAEIGDVVADNADDDADAGDADAGEVEASAESEQSEEPVDDGLAEAEEEWEDFEDEDLDEDAEPLELNLEEEHREDLDYQWYILKVQVNRETSIRDSLDRRVKMHGMEEYFQDIVVPTEDVAEFTKAGKKRIVKKKLFPGYIMVHMAITDESWFLVRETSGIGDFTSSGGKPTPMDAAEVARLIRKPDADGEEGPQEVRSVIRFASGDKVRVKDGNFQNFEGTVESIDETHGRVTVEIVLFGRATPVELEHWQIEAL